MNMPVKVEYFKNPKNRDLTPAELDAFAKELDQIKQEVLDDLGEKDAKYIRRVYAAVRYSSFRPSMFVCRLVPTSMDFRNRPFRLL